MLYDPESNLLSIELAKGEISHAKDYGNFIIHLSKNNTPLLVEILDASKFMGQFEGLKNIKDIKKIIPAG